MIEVTFRSRLAYFLATELGPDGYLDSATYIDQVHKASGDLLRDQLLDDIGRDLDRSKERFIAHHVNAGETVPVWAAVEAMSFGTVSKMYALLADTGIRTKVSKSFRGVELPTDGVDHPIPRHAAEHLRPPREGVEPDT